MKYGVWKRIRHTYCIIITEAEIIKRKQLVDFAPSKYKSIIGKKKSCTTLKDKLRNVLLEYMTNEGLVFSYYKVGTPQY